MLLLGNIGNLSSGLGFGFMGPNGDQIMEQLDIKEDLHSFVVGSVSIGGLMGCFVSGKLTDFFGRKEKATSVSLFITMVSSSPGVSALLSLLSSTLGPYSAQQLCRNPPIGLHCTGSLQRIVNLHQKYRIFLV